VSKVAELAYDIEQMFIEGYSPTTIAALLSCPLGVVYDWLEENGMNSKATEACYTMADYDPFDTINS
jgi:hypothetical protein